MIPIVLALSDEMRSPRSATQQERKWHLGSSARVNEQPGPCLSKQGRTVSKESRGEASADPGGGQTQAFSSIRPPSLSNSYQKARGIKCTFYNRMGLNEEEEKPTTFPKTCGHDPQCT